MGPTKSIYSFCKKNISEINLKLAQSIYSLIYEMDITECTKVYWICLFISWISHPRLCFIAFKMKFNYPVPSHFQFSGRDGSGTWKKVRDGSGTGIPSDPGHDGKMMMKDMMMKEMKEMMWWCSGWRVPRAWTNPSKVLTRSSHLPQVTARGDDDDIEDDDEEEDDDDVEDDDDCIDVCKR